MKSSDTNRRILSAGKKWNIRKRDALNKSHKARFSYYAASHNARTRKRSGA